MDIAESFLYPKKLNAEDVGTRIQHMVELHDLWNTAYGILTRPDLYHTDLEKERAKNLQIAIDFLIHHLEAEFNVTPYAKEINSSGPPPMSIRPKVDPDDFTTHRDTV